MKQDLLNLDKKDPAAVKLGRKGGKEIGKRGPEYVSPLHERLRCDVVLSSISAQRERRLTHFPPFQQHEV